MMRGGGWVSSAFEGLILKERLPWWKITRRYSSLLRVVESHYGLKKKGLWNF
jgi:hypothetical protein